ncbi:SDR family NAD(P)-dependent oxidoreductase [Pseudonocardia sp. Cha107L01]|uniref:SDR family NAD(P)-dependent oxidoreductase n=1 Tax=Pseudonocardia sp. Cha107L01 TaxID=3457576 RepID=UPI00403E94DB
MHTTLAALPMLRHTKGRILAVTSVGGKLPAPHLLPYTTAKHATVGFAEGLRIEASAQGVSVTVGVPGLMRTGSTRNALFAGNLEQERRWFTAGASLPILSMDAERAAAKLVRATLGGRPEVILTPLAKLGVRAHGLAPATTLRALTLVNRLLPNSASLNGPQPGHTTIGHQPGWFARSPAVTATPRADGTNSTTQPRPGRADKWPPSVRSAGAALPTRCPWPFTLDPAVIPTRTNSPVKFARQTAGKNSVPVGNAASSAEWCGPGTSSADHNG